MAKFKKEEKKIDYKERSNRLYFLQIFRDKFTRALFELSNDYDQDALEYQMYSELDFDKQKDYNTDFMKEYLAFAKQTIDDLYNVCTIRTDEYFNRIVKNEPIDFK